jgi:hypothetical protein
MAGLVKKETVESAASLLKEMVGNETVKQVTRKTVVKTVEGSKHTIWEVAKKTGTAVFTYTAKKKLK